LTLAPRNNAARYSLAESHRLYDCHDLLLKHKGALFTHLTERWKDLFNAKFEILLYDLTSTYFDVILPLEKQTSASSATVGTSDLIACRWSSP
jgi:hypothetical protein